MLDVLSLLRSHVVPDGFLLRLIGPLLRSHTIPLIELLPDFVLLFRRHSLEGRAILEEPLPLCRRHLPHLLHPRSRRANSKLLPRRQIPARCIVRSRRGPLIGPVNGRRLHRGACLIHRRPIRIPLRLVLRLGLRWLLLRELRALLLSWRGRWRRSRAALLRHARQRHSPAQGHTQNPPNELESLAHCTLHCALHRLIRLTRLVCLVFLLHRLRQVFQWIEARNHILIVQHLHLLHHLRVHFFLVDAWQ
jgi:hypothetical protein